MKRAIALAAVLALALAGPAQARLPAVGTTVWEPCPTGTDEDGCAYANGIVYVAMNPNGDLVSTFWHEQGHAFDYLRLTWPQRARFRSLVHSHGRPWFDPYGNRDGQPSELFAEAYSACAAPNRSAWWTEGDDLPPGHYHGGDSYVVTRRQYRMICQWLARIA